ncbi:pre-toxin TG domain-containing protein, partial [Achromobacter marplatensis]|uniref:pre-toxin TG domain-containing protein n=1 Tax=Achromobacter marplatensis TaxID=470868 RepID=UPI0039F6932F
MISLWRARTLAGRRNKNLDKVARMKAEVTAKAIATCADDNSCLHAEFDRADEMAAAYDVALTLNHYPQLSKEKADTLAQAVLDLARGVSNASALYEVLTGKTATGDEANRFFAGIGLLPVLEVVGAKDTTRFIDGIEVV